MNQLKGKTILITGGTGGIGLVTEKMFIENGVNVFVTDQVMTKCENKNFFKANASIEDEVKKVVSNVVERFGKIDILFNNCGVGANIDIEMGRPVVFQTALNMNKDDFDFIMSNNFLSAVWFVKYAVPFMPKTEESCIICSSSLYSTGSRYDAIAYTASKASLNTASLSWAHQFAPIRSVNIILGAINTPMFMANPGGRERAEKGTLIRRIGKVEEVAQTVLYIASCYYLNATEIILDGGKLNR